MKQLADFAKTTERLLSDLDANEFWQPATYLHYALRDGKPVLQQLWTSSRGNHKWRDVPTVKGEG